MFVMCRKDSLQKKWSVTWHCACRRTKRRQAEVENLQEAVANAGYETAGHAGYYSSGFGGYNTGDCLSSMLIHYFPAKARHCAQPTITRIMPDWIHIHSTVLGHDDVWDDNSV